MATLGLLERGSAEARDIHAAYRPLPHLAQNARAMLIGAAFDPEAIAPLLPAGMEPLDGATGGFNFIDAPDGWGVTPYRVAWVWIDIKGFHSDSGEPCWHYVFAIVDGSEEAVAYYRQPRGTVAMDLAGPEWVATASSGGDVQIRARGRVTEPPVPSYSDTRNYLTKDDHGGLYISHVSHLMDRAVCEPVSLEIFGDDDTLRRLKPVRLIWARMIRNLSYTCGAWVPLSRALEARQKHPRGVIINFLTRLERPAALVDGDGGIVLINGKAEKLIGDGIGVANGKLTCHLRSNQEILRNAISAVLKRDEKVTVSFERPNAAIPLIVRATPFAFDLPGASGARLTKLALLLFTDPAAPLETDTKPALQLLGLTPAEARAASLVGAGLSPREAAAELGQVENSVRTTLKHVYAKLGLSRQSELALLISRIADILG